MYGLVVCKVPKDVQIPHWVHRSDFWSKKHYIIELGVRQHYSKRIEEVLSLTNSYIEQDAADESFYFYYTRPLSLFNLVGIFPLKNIIWAAHLLRKYNCEVYVYRAY